MNTLADKDIVVLEPPYVERVGGLTLADRIELLMTLHEPVKSVKGTTLEELTSLEGRGDVIVSLDSIRRGSGYIGDPHEIVDLIRAQTHPNMPIILQVFGGSQLPFVQAISKRKNAFKFTHSYPIGPVIRQALGLPK